MDYSHYRQLKIDIVDRIATITMNRPDTLNVVQAEMHTELTRIFIDLENDRDVDIMILTGAGRAFNAGGDIVWMQEGVDDPLSFNSVIREGKQLIFGMLDCEKPIIAKVNGHAVGLGATLALYCDIIFMAENAKIGDPHVKVGLTAGDGGAVIWPQLIGYARAKEYLMTGELISAADAKAMGLVNRVVPREELDAAVDTFARNLNAGAKLAIRGTKTTINIGLRQLAHSIMDASLAYEAMSNASEDHREGVAAFREGRKPVFKGR
ncbi:MAG TPA: enoyl-CoA hydratase-related protein [Nevskiaceae bacterium]|nr:enoyl-CoA hydratase-related protein [Nevskiaceae bacterium]